MKLFYEPQGAYFGDCMPFYHDGKFYVFHQRDKRDPQPFEPFEWSLATTTDFIHYEDMGVARMIQNSTFLPEVFLKGKESSMPFILLITEIMRNRERMLKY